MSVKRRRRVLLQAEKKLVFLILIRHNVNRAVLVFKLRLILPDKIHQLTVGRTAFLSTRVMEFLQQHFIDAQTQMFFVFFHRIHPNSKYFTPILAKFFGHMPKLVLYKLELYLQNFLKESILL